MNNKNLKMVTRRSFIQTSTLGAMGLTIIPGFTSFKPNENINLGFIGLGRQAMFLLNGFINIDGVKVLAAADVYGVKRKRFEQRVTDHYKEKGSGADVKTYENYKDLLARKEGY